MEETIKALFTWAPQGQERAKEIARKYQRAGVHTLLHGQAEQEELIALGNKENATHVLYFIDGERLLLVSLADEMGGFTVEVLVSDLVLPS